MSSAPHPIEWLEASGRRVAARVRGVLSGEERRALFCATLAERRYFVEASTGGAEDYRQAFVHYTTVDEADGVVACARRLGAEVAAGLGLAPPTGRVERQLTVHLDGGFYRLHRDDQGEEASRRLLSYVYYFHGPRRWRGGELVLVGAPPCVVQPEDDTLVMFPSSHEHEVLRLEAAPPLSFEEGRFTVNGWLWR